MRVIGMRISKDYINKGVLYNPNDGGETQEQDLAVMCI